jgi:hypothetical protein
MASTGLNSSVQEADVIAERADIIVGVTSYNDVRTIGDVSRAVRDGLSRYFGETGSKILLLDAGSTDGTREAARDALGGGIVEMECGTGGAGLTELPYHGNPSRARALHAVFESAQRLEAKACAIVEASLQTAEPQWIERLVTPALSGEFDYVSPHYVRRINEGAITKGIVYPLFRSLFGVRLRQPAATEFACSTRLAAHYLEQDIWDLEQASSGIDLWLTVAAAGGQFRMCEAPLGVRGPSSRDTQSDLSTVLAQVVGALFLEVERRVDAWQRVRSSVAVPMIGSAPAIAPNPAPSDVEALIESFRLGYRELREIWTWALPPRTIVELRRLTQAPPDLFRFADRFWAGIIYDFAIAFSQRVLPRDHLLRSLTPLYTGWLASFVLQMRGATPAEADERIEQVCVAFEAEKRYLISRWRWPERFR